MSFTPKFMRQFAIFERERRALRTLRAWRAFEKRWFDDRADWPLKSGAQLSAEQIQRPKLIAILRDGRRWAPGFYLMDITPEARHAYFWTLKAVGAPLEDPRWKTLIKTNAGGWFQTCSYCEISTPDLGSEVCPCCGRSLFYDWVKD